MQRTPTSLFITAALAIIVLSTRAHAQNIDSTAPATVSIEQPGNLERRLVIHGLGGAEGCVAPCGLALIPGRYRIEVIDHASGSLTVTRTSTVMALPSGTSSLRIRRHPEFRTAEELTLAAGALAMIAGIAVIAVSAGGCTGGPGLLDFYYGGSPAICHPGNDTGLAAGAVLLTSGTLSVVVGAILLAIARPTIQLTPTSSLLVSSVSITPSRDGIAGSMAVRF